MDQHRHNPIPTCYYPDTGQPVPFVMTEEELIRLVRLDLTGTKEPGRCLKRYRERGLLKGVQIGKCLRYKLSDALAFIELLQESNPR